VCSLEQKLRSEERFYEIARVLTASRCVTLKLGEKLPMSTAGRKTRLKSTSKEQKWRMQVRYNALTLLDVFVTRSKHFRKLLCDRLPNLLERCIAPKPPGTPLPPPAEQAAALKRQATQLISSWSATYGQHYPQLGVAQRYAAHRSDLLASVQSQ
jgi:hypothetical protein